MSDEIPDWVAQGQGDAPRVCWSFAAEAPLVSMELAGETGEVFAGDACGCLYVLSRRGQVATLTRGFRPLTALSWSTAGNGGAAAMGDARLCRLSRRLEVQWSIDLPDTILTIAVDPYGHHVAVGLANGINHVFDSQKKRVCSFETVRPLSFLKFLATETTLFGAAEYGLLCCHDLDGTQLWNEKLWSNVGDLTVTGDGQTILLAGFNYGIQSFDGLGTTRGSYMVEGTPNHVSMSFQPRRLVASTLERHLYWLDSDGEMLWACSVPDDVCRVICEPLGNWFLCGFASGRIIRLDWSDADDH